mmetsp:Transcript_33848/g.83163  ORF Transcript_33848/g.83163 Transcript_33848/m.83163 type:complete len:594 (+) Transcript_33848:42-1823(+)
MAGVFIPLEHNALVCFAAKGDLEAVKCLVEAVSSSRADIREMTLVRKRIPPDARGMYGDTALHAACANGHLDMVSYLLEQEADPSIQNDMGQTPLFVAAMHANVRCVEKLITGGADIRRISIDGKNALDVACSLECRFLLRSLQNDAEDEAARAKAEAAKRRLELMMLRWSKAAMVDGLTTWKDFALVPESKISRLVKLMDGLGADCTYESPQVGIIAQAQARGLDLDGTQFVVYRGRKGMGVQGGSGHPLLHGLDGAVARTPSVTSSRPSRTASSAPKTSSSSRARSSASPSKSGTRPPTEMSAGAFIQSIEAWPWDTGVIEGPDLFLRKALHSPENLAQLQELERDVWGMRSISTARQWARVFMRYMLTAELLVKRFHFVMKDPRPGTGLDNLETIRSAVIRMIDRLVCPHRTMLHGLRPRAFRSAVAQKSQALVNSSAFPPNFPGTPGERRLFTSRFVNAWAWMTACNNPPGYTQIPDLQDVVRRVAGPLKLHDNPDIEYLLHPAFVPQDEGPRMHVQAMNLPLPPRHHNVDGSRFYYQQAICKVENEPAADFSKRARASSPSKGLPEFDEGFEGGLVMWDTQYVDEFVM